MPLILGTNSIKDTGYDVANSCRFNDGDSAYMHKTFGTGGSTTAWTMSMWVKRGVLGTDQRVFSCDDSSDGDPDNYWRFKSDDTLQVNIYNSSAIGNLVTNRKFRDCSSWYHVCVIWKSGDSTSTDRLQLWVNGTRETSFSATTFPSQNANSITASQVIAVGRRNYAGEQHFDGYLAEVVFLDGVTASPVDTLGEFDSDSPTIFKPKDPSGLSFGSTGFYLDFEDSANLGNDANGGTDLTEVNLAATDQATDTPTNNFATMNPLSLRTNAASVITLSEGNLKAAAGSGSTSWLTRYAFSNIGVSAGKWWVEIKCVDSGASNQFYLGIVTNPETKTWDSAMGDLSGAWGYYSNDGSIYHSGSHTGGTKVPYGDGDFVGIALDCDNGTVQFYKDGAVSSDQVTGLSTTADWFFALDGYAAIDAEFNFGSPIYSISSGNADDNGYGNFEHAPPSGFLALCTKNLGSDGG